MITPERKQNLTEFAEEVLRDARANYANARVDFDRAEAILAKAALNLYDAELAAGKAAKVTEEKGEPVESIEPIILDQDKFLRFQELRATLAIAKNRGHIAETQKIAARLRQIRVGEIIKLPPGLEKAIDNMLTRMPNATEDDVRAAKNYAKRLLLNDVKDLQEIVRAVQKSFSTPDIPTIGRKRKSLM